MGVDVGAFDLGDDGAGVGIGLIAGVGVDVGVALGGGVVVGVGFGGAVAVVAVAVDASEVLGRVVSDVWVGLFVGVAGCGVVDAAGVEIGDCCGVDSGVVGAAGVCRVAGAAGGVAISAAGGAGCCCVGGEFVGVLSVGVFDGFGTSGEGRSSDDPVGLGGLVEDVSLVGGVGVSVGASAFGFGWVVSPVDGVSVGLLLLGLDVSVSPGELSGVVGLFGVEGGAESVATLPSLFDGAESPAGGVPFVPLLFGVVDGSPVVGASGVLF
ncbi:hypothetical protein [Nocardia salmonicida]|uniref:hypothetical protein n=1 Tax=Nocardia salmonicida TaxID=53431 RepID=UPI0010421CBC|nr:hypothetical protein [Nocardia salmonicida]